MPFAAVRSSNDNRENFALDFGKSFLHYGWEKNVDRLYEQVDEITAAQIQAVAQELFDKDRLTTLIFKKFLKRKKAKPHTPWARSFWAFSPFQPYS